MQLKALEVLRDMLENKLVPDSNFITVMNQCVKSQVKTDLESVLTKVKSEWSEQETKSFIRLHRQYNGDLWAVSRELKTKSWEACEQKSKELSDQLQRGDLDETNKTENSNPRDYSTVVKTEQPVELTKDQINAESEFVNKFGCAGRPTFMSRKRVFAISRI